MAGPIKIAILADVGKAVKSVTHFRETVDSETKRVVTTLGDSKLTNGFGKVQEGFDVADTRAMGFRDTLTGVQDTMAAFNALTSSTTETTKRVADAQAAYNDAVKQYGPNSVQAATASTNLTNAQKALDQQQGSTIDKMFLLGTGVGDLASGFANFIVPMIAMGVGLKGLTGSMRALNLTMLANPIFLVIAAVVALVAVFVIAYKKSDTFRRIVDGAFRKVKQAAQFAWQWIKTNWPLLLAVITGPIGIAILLVVRNFDRIRAVAGKVKGWIVGAVRGAKSWLSSAGRNIIDGLIAGLRAAAGNAIAYVGRLGGELLGAMKRKLGIASPSKRFAEVGKWIGRGLVKGIAAESPNVERAAVRLGNAIARRLEKAEGKLKDLLKAREDYTRDLKRSLVDSASIANVTTPEGGRLTTAELLRQMKVRLEALRKWQRDLAALRKGGLNKTTLQQLLSQGPEAGGAAADALVAGGKGAIGQINRIQRDINRTAGDTATAAGRRMYDAGIQAAKGLVQGLKRGRSALLRVARDMGRDVADAVRKALGIRSPSRVMRRLGAYLPQGFALGIDDGTKRVRAAAGRMASASVAPIAGATGAAGAGAPAVLELRSSGSRLDDLLMEVLRESIRKKGGNVQVVLGRG